MAAAECNRAANHPNARSSSVLQVQLHVQPRRRFLMALMALMALATTPCVLHIVEDT